MALIDDVKAVCDRLAPLGWRDLLLHVTQNRLDIRQDTPKALAAVLSADLTAIDRSFPGFMDFSVEGRQGVTPGSPGRSLLYHAFASSRVTTGVSGPLLRFPTLREIEALENYVFGAQPPTLAQIRKRAGVTGTRKLSIVIFAYEYRTAGDTCSRLEADLVFSRTGISRVGTREALYDPEQRGFQSEVEEDPFAFHVCPARFGAFLAVHRKGSAAAFTPMRPQPGDNALSFWVPVHKLFNGKECIQGFNLQIQFSAFHYNDKVRRVQVFLKNNPPAVKPYQFSDDVADILSDPDLCEGLVSPIVHPRLVEPAVLDGKFVTFRVPAAQSTFGALEPGAAADPATGAEIRPAPAYVHARTEVRNGALLDLSNDSQRPDVLATVSNGNYDALHYIDFTGDGQIGVHVPALAGHVEIEAQTVPAYSLVAAPDFFPSAGQRQLTEWASSPDVPAALRENIWGVPPMALCDTRLPANLQMPGNHFDASENTITALVPMLGPAPATSTRPASQSARRHSSLPDDAAGVFAPGWDVSTDNLAQGSQVIHHLAAYGLGSPFPEDSKLCAALSTFWATVAPDITRGMSISTGNPALRHTVAPLTDQEIGQIGSLPWDGNPGPHLVTINGQPFAECESFLHVDYVRSAVDGRFSSRLTSRVTSDEYERRVLAMALTYVVVGGNPNQWFVFSFLQVQNGDPELHRAQIDASTVLPGAVYRFELFQADSSTELPSPASFRKRLLPITDRRFFLVDPQNRLVLQRRADQQLWALAPVML